MQKSLEDRVAILEGRSEAEQNHDIALRVVLGAALQTICSSETMETAFIGHLKTMVDKFDGHMLGVEWSDKRIAATRKAIANYLSSPIAIKAGLEQPKDGSATRGG